MAAIGARSALRDLVRRTGFDVMRYPPRRPGYSLDTVLQAAFARRGITHVVDVGARNGEYGTYLRQIGYTGRIVSFEPVAAHFANLSSKAGADGRWDVHPSALGSSPGTAEIRVAAASDFSSFRTANAECADQFPDGAKVDHVERVQVARLDDRLDTVVPGSARVMLKMDTQGWDLEVLKGAERSLERIEVVQTEVAVRALYDGAPDHVEMMTWLRDHGFAFAGMFPVSYRETPEEGADPLTVLECDLVCVRRAD